MAMADSAAYTSLTDGLHSDDSSRLLKKQVHSLAKSIAKPVYRLHGRLVRRRQRASWELVQTGAVVMIALVWKLFFEGILRRHDWSRAWFACGAMLFGFVVAGVVHRLDMFFRDNVGFLFTPRMYCEAGRQVLVVFVAVSLLACVFQEFKAANFGDRDANGLSCVVAFSASIIPAVLLAKLLPPLPEEGLNSPTSATSPSAAPTLAVAPLQDPETPTLGGAFAREAALKALDRQYQRDVAPVPSDSLRVSLLRFLVESLAVCSAWAGEQAVESGMKSLGLKDCAFFLLALVCLFVLWLYQHFGALHYPGADAHGKAVIRELQSLLLLVLPHVIAFAWFEFYDSLFGVEDAAELLKGEEHKCGEEHEHHHEGSGSEHGETLRRVINALSEHAPEEGSGSEEECGEVSKHWLWVLAFLAFIIFPLWYRLVEKRTAKDESNGVLCYGRGVPTPGLPHAMSWHHTVRHFFSHLFGLAIGFTWASAVAQTTRWDEHHNLKPLFVTLITTLVGCLWMALSSRLLARIKKDEDAATPRTPVTPGTPRTPRGETPHRVHAMGRAGSISISMATQERMSLGLPLPPAAAVPPVATGTVAEALPHAPVATTDATQAADAQAPSAHPGSSGPPPEPTPASLSDAPLPADTVPVAE
eukprot:TRINITY_DN46779_c0_g1_i1.p1 TRINITY_DN46779_c0_g1~~TRINITY_DN46779_c0_g1_i1.p1  ORF type:complete len:644 (+),score=139.41 TRINITY_DN46779_c0_g1_i1:117-2048(+)